MYVSCNVYYPIKNRLCLLIYELNVKNLPNMSLIAIISLDLQYGLVLQSVESIIVRGLLEVAPPTNRTLSMHRYYN